jgi:type IV pilus assembly protein PilN
MPRINLLPYRATQRREKAFLELKGIGVGGVCLLTALLAYASWEAHRGSLLEARIGQTQQELGDIDKLVARVEDFKSRTATLQRKLATIDHLKKQKLGPARMLSDLADILTHEPKVWLTSVEEHGGRLALKGGAMDQGNLSHFQMALEKQSLLFNDVHLTLVNSANEGSFTYFQWTLSCRTQYGGS